MIHPDYGLVTKLRILEAVKSNGPLSKNQVRIQAHLSYTVLADPLNELINSGHIKNISLRGDRRLLITNPSGREAAILWTRVKHLLEERGPHRIKEA